MDTKKTLRLTMAKEHEPCSGYDQKARSEILRGCELAKRLEEHLKEAPLRSLDEASNHDLCLAFLRSSSLEIAEAFRNASVLLQSQLIGSAEQLQVNHGYLTKDSSPARKRSARGKISIKTESLISPTRTRDTSTLSPWIAPSSAAAGPSIPSPRMSSSDKSESSPAKSSLPEPDSGDSAASSRVRKIHNVAAKGCEEQANAAVRDNSRKRKVLPKITLKFPSMDEGEGPPNDGFTWRKYGQKVILGTRHPRCYYRCTHKYDVGCPAKKQVQKTDDNPNIFEVTYQGFHSCLPHTLNSAFCFPPLSIPSLNIQQLQSINSNCSAAIQLNPSPHLLLPFSSQYSPLHFPSSYLSPDQAPRTFMQPSPTSSYSLQPIATDLGTAEFEPASTINLDANTSDSFSFEVACCTTADTSATTSQNSSPARNCNTPVLTEAINFEPLTATLGREPQIYDTSMHPSTKDNASADFLPHFLLPLGANLQEAGRSFQGSPLLEQLLASQREATQEEGIMEFPPFLDEFSYMEEEILGIDDLSIGRAAL